MLKKLTLLLFITLSTSIKAQTAQLSVYSKVSIITVGPGEKLYEKFGHSAIRVKDPVLQIDLIYNYGIFDFNAPNFYTNFTKGKLIYKLAGYPFKYFEEGYKRDGRWIKEQNLNLTQDERQQFFMYLYKNALPANASYEYDPFFNNCATKMRDVVEAILQNKVSFNDSFVKNNMSLRELMNEEIHWNTWGSLGINVALGSKLDKIATAKEYLYLPKYVYNSFEGSTFYSENQPKEFISSTKTILDLKEIPKKSDVISPFLIFSILLLLGLYITYKDIKNNSRTRWFDFVLFFTTGVVGLLIVFLWFFTNHSTTPNNFNFLWALAPNLIVAFFLLKKKTASWIKKYVWLLLLFLIAIPVIWISKIQLFAWSLLPIYILLLVRYFYLQKVIDHA